MTVSPIDSVLSLPLVDRTRRNHGLEHATMTLLSQRQRGLTLAGHSMPDGFRLYGEVSAEAVAAAVEEALRRLRAGEASLALHPNCGTNFVTAGLAAALAAYVGFLGADSRRARWERLPLAASLATLALIFARPVGLEVQRRLTTSGDMRGLEVVEIRRRVRGRLVEHFVRTRG